MHIGMIMSTPLPPREGIGFFTWNLAKNLVKQGHHVTVITRGTVKASWCETVDGIVIWRATFLPVYPFHVHTHSFFVNRLVKMLDPQVDVWHLHSPLVRFPKTTRPVLVTVHSPMMAATKRVTPGSVLGMLINLQTPTSIVLEKEVFQKSNAIITVAESIIEELKPYKVDLQKTSVLGNGTDTRIFLPEQIRGEDRKPYFLTAGRLAPAKGLEDLLECAEIIQSKYPGIEFRIAGTGPLFDALKSKIHQRGLENKVFLLGHVSNRLEMASLYQNAIAYLHPSHYEGLPTVLLEAMACEKPVISTAISGALDVVQDGINGLLVPPHAPSELAKAVFTLLETPGLGEKFGTAARETIQQRYSWDVVSKNYIAQYQALLNGELN